MKLAKVHSTGLESNCNCRSSGLQSLFKEELGTVEPQKATLLSQAYLQLQVDDASMPYVTVNTHQRLYQYT